jgi:chlorite dismutase
MYGANALTATEARSAEGAIQRKLDITLRENIDTQIGHAEKHVESLKAAKERMEKSGMLDMRIDDIQAAMRW